MPPPRKTVLFVDHDTETLDRLASMMRDRAPNWDARTAESASEALAVMVRSPVDVVVVDADMPGVDGGMLLHEVKERHPLTVRILMAGKTDQPPVIRSLGSAQQHLPRDCDFGLLIETLTRATALGELLGSPELEVMIGKLDRIPSLPAIYEELLQELRSEEPSIQRVGKLIAQDVGMTAKILQLVNSAYFGLPRRVSSPAEAASLLGLATIRALVLSVSIFSQFDKRQVPGLKLDELWRHSVAAGNYARAIATIEQAPRDVIDRAFTAGLLHDAGKLVLASNFPELNAEISSLRQERELSPLAAEREIIGVSHADVGAHLFRLWGLEDAIVEAVAFHHDSGMAMGYRFVPLTAVYIANLLDHETSEGDSAAAFQLETLEESDWSEHLPLWRKACADISSRAEE